MEIIAFSNGDSRETKTWSNVPYLFLKHLEEMGDVKVHRVNIILEDSNRFLKFLFRCVNRVMRGLFGETFSLNRMAFYDRLVRRKMKKALRQHPDADVLLTFDFSHVLTDVKQKTVLFCDWTIQYKIEEHLKRSPTSFERRTIRRQEQAIRSADTVVTFFPNVYEKMRESFGDRVKYVGNFINSVEEPKSDFEEKQKSREVLFVGNKSYLPALLPLIGAVRIYNEQNAQKKLHLNVIGMTEEMAEAAEFVTYHGYLNKNDEEQRKTYYRLMNQSTVMVNTAPHWVGASSIIEGLYFGTPVIITPNEDLVKTFGREIGFGFYCEENEPSRIASYLERLDGLSEEDYRETCKNAQSAVAEFTWDSYIRRWRELIEN